MYSRNLTKSKTAANVAEARVESICHQFIPRRQFWKAQDMLSKNLEDNLGYELCRINHLKRRVMSFQELPHEKHFHGRSAGQVLACFRHF